MLKKRTSKQWLIMTAVLSFSLALARAVRLKGVEFKMMLVSVVVTLALSAGAVYGVYQIVA